jgi:flagellar hook-associated protein 3 FlgL
MSTSIGQYGASAANLVLTAAVQELTNAQTTLAWQTSNNGITAETFAGLGSSRTNVFELTPKITQVNAWQSNITSAQNSLTVTASALKQIVSLAQSMATSLLSIGGSSSTSAVNTVATEASSSLGQLATVLNTSNGTGYVFAGQSSTEAPVTDPSSVVSGTTSSQIAPLMASGASIDSILQQATTLMNGDSSIFSSTISSPTSAADSLALAKSQQTSTITGDSAASHYGIVATQGNPADANATSTGSPIKDLMRDMMLVSGMQGMSSTSPGYSDMIAQLHTSLVSTTNQLISMETAVGAQQNALTARSTLLTNTATALQTQLDNARTTDIGMVAIQSANVQTSLKASFMLIANMKDMSLANYL